MDPVTIAAALVTVLGPHLPTLLGLGGKVAGGAAEKVGEKLVEGVGKLWERLRGRVEAQPALKSAAQDLAQAPTDKDLEAALRVQLRKLLESDPAFANEIAVLLKSTGGIHIEQNVSGQGNVVGAGDQHIGSITQHFK